LSHSFIKFSDTPQNAKKNIQCAFLIIYLGKLPSYFDFWAKSCETNHENFHWFIYNDHIDSKRLFNKAVTIVPYTFETLCRDLKNTFNIHVQSKNTRIVCDCRIMLYPIRKNEEALDNFDLIGYSDLDILYGQIKTFLPENALNYSMISAHDNRPCGPLTLFNKKYLQDICKSKKIKGFLELDHGDELYESQEYSNSASKFKPMSGNTIKDKIAKKIKLTHLDESEDLVEIAEHFAPVFCKAIPLQPTMGKGFNHRKAIAFWDKGRLYIQDVFGHKKEGAIFHFSRFKNRTRFVIDPHALDANQLGIYKYGIIEIKTKLTKLKMLLSLLY